MHASREHGDGTSRSIRLAKLPFRSPEKLSRATAEDLRNIFSGTVTDRTPEVVHGSPNTNVFLFWSGHGETSHADVMDGGIYLSNRFTRVFHTEVERNPAISIHDLYYQLATHTTGSHAGLYNDACYGNVYRNTLEEFFTRTGQ